MISKTLEIRDEGTRSGHAASLQEAKNEIDYYEDEQA